MSRWKPDAAGRLMAAAIALYDEQGYEATTVAEIAARAGLTKRTFFRHFADKREVLFIGSLELIRRWQEAVTAAPASATPLAAVTAGFEPVAEMFADRHSSSRVRARIVRANPEVQERELIKLQALAQALAEALCARGVDATRAMLAAQTASTVFHDAFGRWVADEHPAPLSQLLEASLRELQAVTAA